MEKTITEDFATGMNIEGKGYRCYGVDDVHASGESPVGLNELVKQRKRWARGFIHTLRKQKLVWGLKDLDFHQKVSYTVSVIY